MTHSNAPTRLAAMPKASLWRRFAALVYDGLILLALSFAYGAVITALGAILSPGAGREYAPMFHSHWVLVGWLFVLVGFYVFFWRRGGQTIGMRTWRLQLINCADGPLTRAQMTVRIAVAILGFAAAGSGYFYRWFNANGDCLHDQLSRTAVIVLPKKR